MSIQWQDSFVQFTDDFVIWKSVVSGTATGSIEFTATANAKNYQLATASGAIEFVAAARDHNDFTDDDTCISVWPWEAAAPMSDIKGGNDLTNDGVTVDTEAKEGGHSALFTAAGLDYASIADGDLDHGTPCKSYGAVWDFTYCGWFKLTSLPASGDYRHIFGKFATDENQFLITAKNDGADTSLEFLVSNNGTTWTNQAVHASALAVDTWYHIGVTWDYIPRTYWIRIWDDTAKAILGVDKTGNFATGIANREGALVFGNPDADTTFDGQQDESILFNTPLSTGKIDAVRAGTFQSEHGTASGSFGFTATAIAHNYNLATASGAIEFTGSAVAHNYNIATATGSCEFTASAVGKVLKLGVTSGVIEFTATATAHTYDLAIATGAIEFTASAVGKVLKKATASGSIEFVGTAEGENYNLALCVGAIEFVGTAIGKVLKTFTAVGSCEFTGTALGAVGFAEITPEMHAALIDPYSGGAWLWLVKIKIPGYDYIRLARNTEDVTYADAVYTKSNFDVGLAPLTGDGSVPRIMLRVTKDADYTLENKINATQGASGGTIKIIRMSEDFLDDFVQELEQTVRILTAESDVDHVTFQLGIPNPLMRKIPLRRYSSKVCPYALPSLFKGPECQYAGADTICGGKFEDCHDKSNEVHWGAEIGLDPNTVRA